jgi:hypothetical protein
MPRYTKNLVLAILTVAGATLPAQGTSDKWDIGMKIRGGATSGDLADDMNSAKFFGLGLAGSWSLSQKSALVCDIAFLRIPGKDVLRPLPANVVVSGSTDRRKNELQGFSARFGYRSAIASTGWDWQAGISLDKLQSRQEASGHLTVGTAIVESIAATPTSSKVLPGAFLGLVKKVGEDFTVEFNAFTLGYSQVEWVPRTYSGTTAAATTSNHRGAAIEIAMGFRF